MRSASIDTSRTSNPLYGVGDGRNRGFLATVSRGGRLSTFLLVWMAMSMIAGRVALGQVRVDAVAGEPFGVGALECELPPDLMPRQLGPQGLQIVEANGRVFYPTVVEQGGAKRIADTVQETLERQSGRLGQLMRQRRERPLGRLIDGILEPVLNSPRTTIYFLFQGTEPLEVTLVADQPILPVTITPRYDANRVRQLLGAWWDSYAATPGLFAPKDDYPPILDTYLQSMLAYRMRLEPPKPRRESRIPGLSDIQDQLGVTMASTSTRLKMQRQRFLGAVGLRETARNPLPEPTPTDSTAEPWIADDVEVESLAMHAPADCLYLRFGSFGNFLWMQDTLKKWGGDMQNLVSLRGLDHGLSEKIESQLVMKQSALARLFGGAAIADVAIVAGDMHFQDGGAFGLLFQARNSFMLASDIKRQRNERLEVNDGVTEETVKIAGRDVSLLTTPDGSVRSFYVADGEYHLVTRSEAIVRGFLAAAEGDALGATPEFAHARSVMPLDRGDAVFVYIPSALIERLVGPHHHIETIRRTQALADLEMVELAHLAALAESRDADTIEKLVAGGLLPPDFGPRPDGSETVLDGGLVYDSLRGTKGNFLPVADMPVEAITDSELAEYRQFESFQHSQWDHFDPIMVGIRPELLDSGIERVMIDARMSPFSDANYQRLRRVVGPPDSQQLARVAEDIAAIEVNLPNQRLFAGLQDVHLGTSERPEGITGTLLSSIFQDFLVGYIGGVGDLGILKIWDLTMPPGADAAGYAVNPLGLWRKYHGEFTLFSFQREVLDSASAQLGFVPAEREAQIRFHLEDISHAQVTPSLNNFGFGRTCNTSRGNLRLLRDLDQQLHIPGPDCRLVAEHLLGATMVCPLGGDYEYRPIPPNFGRWATTSLDTVGQGGGLSTQAPPGFVSPPLSWFRGAEGETRIAPEGIIAHIQVDMQPPVDLTSLEQEPEANEEPPRPRGSQLPSPPIPEPPAPKPPADEPLEGSASQSDGGRLRLPFNWNPKGLLPRNQEED